MITPNERFELLSAYIDGELTEAEEQLVEQWLSDDVDFRRIYLQQMKLRQSLIDLPVPVATNSSAKKETEIMIDRVFAEIDKRSQRRKWKIAGIGISVAAVVGVFGSLFTLSSSPQFSPVANSVKSPAPVVEEPVLIAMEEPLVPLPKSMNKK
ncbi:MAG: anti-sigma factor family protein [Pseudanabaena sp.]|uniref:anti-sigma factor family protein n=1 Tax=Pseudanabaena mucicola TaxID=71190 RepID=UPI0025791D96|nr:zf-HC2 domain-containing protein [Pseudanabaena mucicola]MCA6584732.1 zf-HC2 domain-containing protein [Pseudanabaena sp. M34BS1SP1A06MG]MCA6590169.1 zf-HC2 domain-containing protein [Pseudanabaena sp. M109S1SP1A06QC]MCA6594208.1 zf-HC2 domain-containing protein [Pseudanabaena sp. M38BS1SP1A06MG]MCA6596762.1 zf-HC2 domain-containing protein [Pseudanabaena sp. M046S1SP1A06QC]MCA6599251.1 zf-HC2 domain-containing protein [Pseudanabaena sp. M57BS1SP1A06MG]MCA6613145.1 zf-HC2 domain-containing